MTVKMGLVLDCADPEALAEFWAPALGYTNVGSAGSYVMLLPGDGDGPQLLLQRVAEAKAAKNRMHLDIHVADIERRSRPTRRTRRASTRNRPARRTRDALVPDGRPRGQRVLHLRLRHRRRLTDDFTPDGGPPSDSVAVPPGVGGGRRSPPRRPASHEVRPRTRRCAANVQIAPEVFDALASDAESHQRRWRCPPHRATALGVPWSSRSHRGWWHARSTGLTVRRPLPRQRRRAPRTRP